jgi:rhodanese-related sulfurtransferase
VAEQTSEVGPKHVRWLVGGLALAGGLLPLIVYGIVALAVTSVTPSEARSRLQTRDRGLLLVDVRTGAEFAQGHIDGAVSWPLEQILEVRSAAEVPQRLRDETLLLVCDVGLASHYAAWHLTRAGLQEVSNVRGGIQAWIRNYANEQPFRRPPADGQLRDWLEQAPAPESRVFDQWRSADGRVVSFPFRRSPLWEQAAAVIAYFVLKPIYMTLSVMIAVVLWRSRDPDLVAVRWAMIAFFLGETACAVNYFAFREDSYLWEYLHCYGMLVCFGFATFAVLEGMDRRMIHLSDARRRCAALPLCINCIKHGDFPCGLKRMFYLIIPALMLVALILPMADWQDASYNTLVFGQVYNYAHLRVHQMFENWYCAAAAITLFAVSLGILAWKRDHAIATAKVTFAAGVGALGFGMMRMVQGGAFDQNRVWYLWWEEATELLFVVAVAVVLWIFRRSLVPEFRGFRFLDGIHLGH